MDYCYQLYLYFLYIFHRYLKRLEGVDELKNELKRLTEENESVLRLKRELDEAQRKIDSQKMAIDAAKKVCIVIHDNDAMYEVFCFFVLMLILMMPFLSDSRLRMQKRRCKTCVSCVVAKTQSCRAFKIDCRHWPTSLCRLRVPFVSYAPSCTKLEWTLVDRRDYQWMGSMA